MEHHGDRPLTRMPLVDLITCIVEHSDQDALKEFHDRRTVFTFGARGRLRLVEYVDCLRVLEAERGQDRMADHAYGLTIAKFSRLPPSNDGARPGTDCRKYFRPFVERMKEERSRLNGGSAVQEEYEAAERLQRLVAWHFHLSLRESIRHECPGMSRYDWKLPTGTISVLMPKTFAGRRRGEWLTANIPDPDAGRPNEGQRVQDLINRHFGLQFEALDDNADYGMGSSGLGHLASGANEGSAAVDLIEALAAEKAARRAELSRGIRHMRGSSLKDMIRVICNNLMNDDAGEKQIAKPCWMGKVEFSRFAGTRWAARKTVPVLWANLAHLLASRADFAAAAKAAGIWSQVGRIVKRTADKKPRGSP